MKHNLNGSKIDIILKNVYNLHQFEYYSLSKILNFINSKVLIISRMNYWYLGAIRE